MAIDRGHPGPHRNQERRPVLIRYECDLCGAKLTAESPARFIVKMEIFAAAPGTLDLDSDASSNPAGELKALVDKLRHADPGQIEDRTYRSFRFDLCDTCRARLIANPLRP